MVTLEAARQLALSLPGAEERDHFGSPSYRVVGKIFAQLPGVEDENARVLVKLAVADQAALVLSDPDVFCSVPEWGRYGWTYVRLADLEESMLRDLLSRSWRLVAPRKLVVASDSVKAKKKRRGG